MIFLDRKSAAAIAGRFAGRGMAILMLVFLCIIVALWWFQVFKFFLYDHWKPTAWFVACCMAWYVIGRAIEQFDRHTRRLHRRRHDDPNYFGDDDCA